MVILLVDENFCLSAEASGGFPLASMLRFATTPGAGRKVFGGV